MIARLLISGLATWRLSSLLLYEDGPGDIFLRFRQRIGVDRPGQMSQFAVLFSCMWCLSVWVAAGVTLFYDRFKTPIFALASSALAIALHEQVQKKQA